jgi:hypothetical protein
MSNDTHICSLDIRVISTASHEYVCFLEDLGQVQAMTADMSRGTILYAVANRSVYEYEITTMTTTEITVTGGDIAGNMWSG